MKTGDGLMTRPAWGWFLLFLLIQLAATAPCSAQDKVFRERTTLIDEVAYSYRVFRPVDWRPDKKWPVILFLHGAGERGSENVRQTQVGLGPVLRQRAAHFPAVVVMPQCRRGVWWGDPFMEKMVFQALDASIEEFNGDPSRIYLTGLSMGGYGTWAFGYKYAGRFAALVPVCGGVVSRYRSRPPVWHPTAVNPSDPYGETARGIRAVPVWAFHGAADPVVPASESRRLTEALKAQGGEVKYTEYAGVAHNSWDRAYAESGLISWMLAQSLRSLGR